MMAAERSKDFDLSGKSGRKKMAYETINPATGARLRKFEEISDAQLELSVANAQRAYQEEWRNRSAADRAKVLAAAAALLRQKADEYARLVTLEMGKLLGTAQAEVQLSAAILDYYADNAERFLKPQTFAGFPDSVLETRPLGIVLAIEPWNFPYYQAARVVGPQLAAGNVVLLKHAECVPQCALAFERLFHEAGAPSGVFTNLFASIEQVGRLIEDPRVVGVTITGSERAGAAVAERAGRNLKKVVMELGGSDPLIVLEDAPLESTIQSAMFGRMFNTGQSCVASKRIIVVGKERGKAFVDGFVAGMAGLKVGDPAAEDTSLGPVSSERALNLLLDQIDSAKRSGATVLLGGARVDRPGFYLQPTVITNIDAHNPAFSQEFFGPVASVYVVESEVEAIRLANATPFGLGGSVFTADVTRGRAVADRIESGMVWVNQPAWTTAELPFGGIKQSGYGRELSELGFGEFVNRKLITAVPAGSPPWGPVQ
jgi:succinate-semialdehyde dehydrogenase/glutarate-semialdehyde dehydrogenase